MEFADGIVQLNSFFTVTVGIIVLFIGRRLNQVVGFLKEFSIPEPVSGGIIFSILFTLIYAATSIEINFDLMARDVLLVYFFTTIGINASLGDLLKGGRPLVFLFIVALGYMILQAFTGKGVAPLFGQERIVGLLGGGV